MPILSIDHDWRWKFMNQSPRSGFSGPVTVFRGRRVPERGVPAGYAALIGAYALKVPLPRRLSAIGERHRIFERDGWQVLTPRHAPDPSLEGHLTFALKYEGLDLIVLKRLFEAAGSGPIAALVRSTPTGRYARRIWFLYEWLLGRTLDLPDGTAGKYVAVVDTRQQHAARGENITRQRVRNNLPGSPEFCPLVFRTEALDDFIAMDLPKRAQAVMANVAKDVIARTAAFLLLKDSRSSFAIEGEQPPQDRLQRWGLAIGEAGRNPTDFDELMRLQNIVIGDTRFVHIGLRVEGGFLGEHDRATRLPLPDHISARPEDLPSLLDGIVAFERGPGEDLDPVIEASALAFGFVYAHPFEDGNGRIHRYLIHHILSKRGFNPPGIVFPVSAAILDKIDEYRAVLEDYAKRLLPLIEWQPTQDGNVRVTNDTGDFYRFFDATPHAEFIYACVRQTIERDLPEEMRFLQHYDEFCFGLRAIVDMPNRTMDLLFRFLSQNDGKLSNRARSKEFAELTNREVERIQALYADALGEH